MIPTILTAPLPNAGTHGRPITQLVVHSMGERIGGVPAHEFLASVNLSAHALVNPDGSLQHCIGRLFKASHVLGMNTGRLGIELLVAGDHTLQTFYAAIGWDGDAWQPVDPLPPDPYTDAQYATLAWWLAQEARIADLGWSAVVTHHQLQPDRKADPGPVFDLDRLERLFTLERELAA